MHQPFKDIKNAKYFITKMQSDLDNIRNPKVKDFQIDALNSFIVLVNAFENFLQNRYKLDVVDGLICGRLNALFFNLIKDDQSWSIEEVVRVVSNDLEYPSIKKDLLVSMLFTEEVMRAVEGNKQLPKSNDFEVLVNELLQEFKQQMVWS